MITATQRENRIKGIGSSDAAAILGYSPFANAADIRLIKLGLAEPEEPGELAEIGTHLEDGIASLASKRLGVKFVKPTSSYWHENGVCFCHPDRQVDESKRGSDLGEMKDSGVDDGWGEEGTADIPAHVLIQCCHQMLCTDAALVHVARLGRGFRRGLFLYEVSRRSPGVPTLIEFMEKALRTWWERHIVNQDPLPDTAPPASMELLKLVRREPKSTVKINSDLVRQWRDDSAAAKSPVISINPTRIEQIIRAARPLRYSSPSKRQSTLPKSIVLAGLVMIHRHEAELMSSHRFARLIGCGERTARILLNALVAAELVDRRLGPLPKGRGAPCYRYWLSQTQLALAPETEVPQRTRRAVA